MTILRAGRSSLARSWAIWIPAFVLTVQHAAGADAVRDFNADTPGKSYTPHTVAQGYLQLESDVFHITEVDGTRLIESFDPVLKYGLTNDVDIEVQTNGLLNQIYQVGGRTVHLTGFGDIIPGIKWGVLGNDSQNVSVAVRAGFKIPTASAGLGNGAAEYLFAVPAQVALPFGLSLQVQEEIDLLKNQNDTGKHFEYSETASIGASVGKTSASAELFAQSGTDYYGHALYTADLSVGYALTPTSILTFGTYIGMNRFAPGVEAFSAFGFRF